MKIAALQTVSTANVDANLAAAARLIAEAAAQGAELVALPEYFCFMGHKDIDKLAVAETPGDGPIQAMLADAARRHGVWVIGGTVPLRTGNPEQAFNASCVWSPQGEVIARYDKVHLFRYDNGRERHDEARVLQAGSQPVACELKTANGDLRLGLSICYDLRFPELYRRLTQPPCDLIAVPSAFTYPTGSAHWEVLLRARAIENQCYVIAPGQGGTHETGRRTYGHSMIIDPWGKVLAVKEEGEGVVIAELSSERIAEVRKQLPALTHRRF